MTYLALLRHEWRLLIFGLSLTCLSGFGQTFFIALFGNDIRAAFDLSHAAFGSLYAIATCASAISIIWLGKLIDQIDLRLYSAMICIGMVIACFALGSAQSIPALCFAFYLIRLTGQGLMGHTSSTSVARYLADNRGKAVGFSAMGHQLSEVILPVPAVLLIAEIGWRNSWYSFGAVVLVLVLPWILWLLKGHHIRHDLYVESLKQENDEAHPQHSKQKSWTRKEVLKDWRFYTLLPAVTSPAAICTGIFFHQAVLVDSKGWDVAMFAVSFTAFAIAGFISAMIFGALVDRYGSLKLLPTYLLPMAAGLLMLALFDHPMIAFIFMIGFGLSGGAAATIFGALWPELYGSKYLGAIRSKLMAIMVLMSASTPPVVGYIIDKGVPFEHIALGFIVYIFVGIASLLTSLSSFKKQTGQ